MPRSPDDTSESSRPFPVERLPTIESMVKPATTDPARFIAELGGWVLVGPSPVEDDRSEWSFRTLSSRKIRDTSGNVEAVLDGSYVVFVLKKAKPGPFANTILVGRSRANDVCVGHSSVSKLHARIRAGRDELLLSDAGSSNGTKIEGAPLAEGEERPIANGVHVTFGACTFQLFEPARFASLLARFKIGD